MIDDEPAILLLVTEFLKEQVSCLRFSQWLRGATKYGYRSTRTIDCGHESAKLDGLTNPEELEVRLEVTTRKLIYA